MNVKERSFVFVFGKTQLPLMSTSELITENWLSQWEKVGVSALHDAFRFTFYINT